MSDGTTFRATLPDTLSAIKISGSGGVRIQLDVPDTDMGNALQMLVWRDCVLVVSVTPERREEPPAYA